MRVDFKNMPDNSRIWIYQSDRDLNESEISIANAYYEVEGTGTVTLQFDDPTSDDFKMVGIDNYGLKPTETKIKGAGDIKILTDANVDKFSLMLECHKETGFSNG